MNIVPVLLDEDGSPFWKQAAPFQLPVDAVLNGKGNYLFRGSQGQPLWLPPEHVRSEDGGLVGTAQPRACSSCEMAAAQASAHQGQGDNVGWAILLGAAALGALGLGAFVLSRTDPADELEDL